MSGGWTGGLALRVSGSHPHSVFVAASSTIAKTRKRRKSLSTEERIKKMWRMYTVEYYSAIKKKEIPPMETIRINTENAVASGVNQTEKGKSFMRDLTFMWNLNKKKTSQTHRDRGDSGGCQGLGGGENGRLLFGRPQP